MGSFFHELAKKLAERWVTLLLVPGALFAAAVWVGTHLGQTHAWDWSALNRDMSDTATILARQSGGTQAVLVVAVLLVATGVGLAVQALAGVTRLIWLGQWSDSCHWCSGGGSPVDETGGIGAFSAHKANLPGG